MSDDQHQLPAKLSRDDGAQPKPLEVDKAIQRSMPPSVVSGLTEHWIYPPGEARYVGMKVVGEIPAADAQAAMAIIREHMQPCPVPMIMKELARLRSVTKSRPEAEADLTMTFQVFAETMREYPEDAVVDACRYLGRTSTFWPALAELVKELDERVARRRHMIRELEAIVRNG